MNVLSSHGVTFCSHFTDTKLSCDFHMGWKSVLIWRMPVGSTVPGGSVNCDERLNRPRNAPTGPNTLSRPCWLDAMTLRFENGLVTPLPAEPGKQPSTPVGSVVQSCLLERIWSSSSHWNCPVTSTVVWLLGSQRRVARAEYSSRPSVRVSLKMFFT